MFDFQFQLTINQGSKRLVLLDIVQICIIDWDQTPAEKYPVDFMVNISTTRFDLNWKGFQDPRKQLPHDLDRTFLNYNFFASF